MRTPPLLANFIQARVCKLICEKFLTRPDGQLSYQYIPDNGEQQLFGKLDLRQNMIDIYYSESKEMDQYLQEVANGEYQLYPTLMEKGGQKAYLMKWLQIG